MEILVRNFSIKNLPAHVGKVFLCKASTIKNTFKRSVKMQYLIKNSLQEPLQKLLAYANSLGVEVVLYSNFVQPIYQEAFQKVKRTFARIKF